MLKGLKTRQYVHGGYTIVEVMVFLVVSTALFVAAAATISGQQRKTEFTQALNDIESRVKDVANDVSTGFYPNTNNFSCTASGAGPIIQTAASTSQGTNVGCIFIGRVMQFGVQGTNGSGFNVYTVVGQRLVGIAGSAEVTSLKEAKPVAIAQGSGAYASVPNAFDNLTLQNGLQVNKITYVNGAVTKNVGAVGFFTTFNSYGASGNLVSGAQTVQLIPIPATTLNASSQVTADAVDSFAAGAYDTSPDSGVIICFLSGGTNQYGQIIIGSNGRQISTSRVIGSGACP